MSDFEYGQRVLVTEKYRRTFLGHDLRKRVIKGYKREPLLSGYRLLEKPEGAEPFEGRWGQVQVEKEGIFLGYRTLTHGYTTAGCSYGEDYEPPEYHVTERIKCAYVSVGKNTNPIHVPLDAIRGVE